MQQQVCVDRNSQRGIAHTDSAGVSAHSVDATSCRPTKATILVAAGTHHQAAHRAQRLRAQRCPEAMSPLSRGTRAGMSDVLPPAYHPLRGIRRPPFTFTKITSVLAHKTQDYQRTDQTIIEFARVTKFHSIAYRVRDISSHFDETKNLT